MRTFGFRGLAAIAGCVAALAMPTSVMATPVNYTLSFSQGFPNPTTGEFTYDASPIPTFSGFTVTWDGLSFDLTSSANTGSSLSNSDPCFGGAPLGAADAFLLMSGQCATSSWVAQYAKSVGVASFSFSDAWGSNIMLVQSAPVILDEQGIFTTGTYALVPEPLTFSLFGAGLAGAIAMRRRNKKAA